MLFSVVIPTLRREASLRRTLVSLAQCGPLGDGCEVVVVTNGSTDGSAGVVDQVRQSFPRLNTRHVHEPISGLLAGRHRGAAETSGEILSFIDDDIEVSESWFDSIQDAFRDRRVDLVGGPCLPLFFGPVPRWLHEFIVYQPDGRWMCSNLSLIDWGEEKCEIDARFVFGLNFSIRRDSFLRFGGFHPDCLPADLQRYQGDGETGLSEKLRQSGGVAQYHPGAKVWHQIFPDRMTESYFKKRAYYQGVCDSYTMLRSGRTAPQVGSSSRSPSRIRDLARRVWNGCRRLTSRAFGLPETGASLDPTVQRIRASIAESYQSGFEFHQNEAKNDRSLMEWIRRPDYFDCWLPETALTKTSEASPCATSVARVT
jgi:glycosyltransferase involved in cell wall biosynthesis